MFLYFVRYLLTMRAKGLVQKYIVGKDPFYERRPIKNRFPPLCNVLPTAKSRGVCKQCRLNGIAELCAQRCCKKDGQSATIKIQLDMVGNPIDLTAAAARLSVITPGLWTL